MKAVVVYESMYGNTRAVAEAIGEALRRGVETAVLPVAHADTAQARTADLIVAGAPTHALGMPRPKTRQAAVEAAGRPDSGLTLEPGADGAGMREWLPTLGSGRGAAAVFDTRMRMPSFLGHAARPIRRLLGRSGVGLLDKPQSFFVDKQHRLLPGELERAGAWGATLLGRLTSHAPTS